MTNCPNKMEQLAPNCPIHMRN